jgi:hypothetical protein
MTDSPESGYREPIPLAQGMKLREERELPFEDFDNPMGYDDVTFSVYVLEIWKHHPAFSAASQHLAKRMIAQSMPIANPSTLHEEMINKWRYRFMHLLNNPEYVDLVPRENDEVAHTLGRILASIERDDELYEIMDILSVLHTVTAYNEIQPQEIVDIALIRKIVTSTLKNQPVKLRKLE